MIRIKFSDTPCFSLPERGGAVFEKGRLVTISSTTTDSDDDDDRRLAATMMRQEGSRVCMCVCADGQRAGNIVTASVAS